MRRNDLDHAFDATPQVFAERVDQTLRNLKEEEPMRKFTLRAALLAALILLLLCGIAYAVVSMQGQAWYYENRFYAFREYEPEKYQAIMDNLQTEIPQTLTPDAEGLVRMNVQDCAWVPEHGLFTLSFAAFANDPERYELYSTYMMDVDGGLVDELLPGETEEEGSHTEHWLWTEKGYGLPEDVMEDPSKQLLLVDANDWDIYIGESDTKLPAMSADAFIGEEGGAIWVWEFDLNRLDAQALSETYMDADVLAQMLEEAEAISAAIAENTDAGGMLSLRIPYRVFRFTDGNFGEPTPGEVRFEVKTR